MDTEGNKDKVITPEDQLLQDKKACIEEVNAVLKKYNMALTGWSVVQATSFDVIPQVKTS